MAVYLVDYENVKADGLEGIGDLTESDSLYLFYSENADKLTFGLHEKLLESKAKIEYLKADVGTKNALDFQLVTYIGWLIARHSTDNYIIVTNDNGFKSVVTFWRKRNVNIELVANLARTNMKQIEDQLLKKVSALISDPKEAAFVTECILKYKTKQGLNNALVKEYESTKGGQLYKAIKPLILDKKGK
jgi:hypothetical protein